MNTYPKARYHGRTGEMRVVVCEEDEASLGPEWTDRQSDVAYSGKPPVSKPEPSRPPTISIEMEIE